jgi:hypothetical protein
MVAVMELQTFPALAYADMTERPVIFAAEIVLTC